MNRYLLIVLCFPALLSAQSRGTYGLFGSGLPEGQAVLTANATNVGGWTVCLVSPQRPNYPTGTTWAASEAACPSAATTRAAVQSATAGVVRP